MAIIELKKIEKYYRNEKLKNLVLKGIDLTIEEGDFTAVMGASGSGKSTLLNIIGCIDNLTNGEYVFEGKNIENLNQKEMAEMRNKSFGFIFQSYHLIEEKKIIDNVIIPLNFNKDFKGNKKEKALEVLKKFGLEEKANRYPRELSGGEKQRVSIARALINDPKIILADEPTGALDSENGNNVIKILSDISKEGRTVIVITHDENIATKCKKIIKIKDGVILK